MKCVNMKLLPIKAHYFFLYGAMGGILPFMPVFAKSLGISATAVGLIYTILPFCVLLSKPLFGYITDYFRNIKIILVILVVTCLISLLLMLPIPSIPRNFKLKCSSAHNTTEMDIGFLEDCLKHDHLSSCEFQEHLCLLSDICESNCSLGSTNLTITMEESTPNVKYNDSAHPLIQVRVDPKNKDICECMNVYPSSLQCKNNATCESDIVRSTSLFSSYQFWVFMLLTVISGTSFSTAISISDAACCELLGRRVDLYGRQRMWATLSTGSVTFLSGYLNDLASEGSDRTLYSPGFYLMAILIAIDLMVLLKTTINKSSFSTSICKDVGKIFALWETIAFAVGAFLVGALTGLHTNYQFWYLQDLGANQTLLGLAIAFQCVGAEVPFLFFSGWFIKTFGHFLCLAAAFGAFAIRLGLYYVLKNPWWTLPIELFHGLTFATFYAAMTSYASEKAPPGTSATMLGVFGGLYDGLGIAIGSLLGGIGMDKIKGRYTFLTASIIGLTITPFYIIIHMLTRKSEVKKAPDTSYSLSDE